MCLSSKLKRSESKNDKLHFSLKIRYNVFKFSATTWLFSSSPCYKPKACNISHLGSVFPFKPVVSDFTLYVLLYSQFLTHVSIFHFKIVFIFKAFPSPPTPSFAFAFNFLYRLSALPQLVFFPLPICFRVCHLPSGIHHLRLASPLSPLFFAAQCSFALTSYQPIVHNQMHGFFLQGFSFLQNKIHIVILHCLSLYILSCIGLVLIACTYMYMAIHIVIRCVAFLTVFLIIMFIS